VRPQQAQIRHDDRQAVRANSVIETVVSAVSLSSGHLIVNEVWCHPRQRQLAPSLPDDLMAGGEGVEVREAFQRAHVAVVDVLRDSFG
jgi:hypothetical protein